MVVFTWSAVLREQARYVYSGDRGQRLLEAAAAGGWDVDTRPYLAYWLAPPRDRLYMNPQPSMTVGDDERHAPRDGEHQPSRDGSRANMSVAEGCAELGRTELSRSS
jgi:hypothetical protein